MTVNVSNLYFGFKEDAEKKMKEIDNLLDHATQDNLDEISIEILKAYRKQCVDFLRGTNEHPQEQVMRIPVIGWGPDGEYQIGSVEVNEDLSFSGHLNEKSVWGEMIKNGKYELVCFALTLRPASPKHIQGESP